MHKQLGEECGVAGIMRFLLRVLRTCAVVTVNVVGVAPVSAMPCEALVTRCVLARSELD